ncbi:hypothetical protein AB3S75_006768 [Citrus x aurantiifolia]
MLNGVNIMGVDCGLRMEISACGWSWIEEGKGKYLTVAGAGGWSSIDEGNGKYLAVTGDRVWSSIDEGNERENIWMWLELDQRRKRQGKILGWSSIDKDSGKYSASENGIVFSLNETLCLNFGV